MSTIDDYLAFGEMMLNQGKHGSARILSRPSVETMTADHLTPEQKAVSPGIVPGYFDSHGWGFGLSVVTRRDDVAETPGRAVRVGWRLGHLLVLGPAGGFSRDPDNPTRLDLS